MHLLFAAQLYHNGITSRTNIPADSMKHKALESG